MRWGNAPGKRARSVDSDDYPNGGATGRNLCFSPESPLARKTKRFHPSGGPTGIRMSMLDAVPPLLFSVVGTSSSYPRLGGIPPAIVAPPEQDRQSDDLSGHPYNDLTEVIGCSTTKPAFTTEGPSIRSLDRFAPGSPSPLSVHTPHFNATDVMQSLALAGSLVATSDDEGPARHRSLGDPGTSSPCPERAAAMLISSSPHPPREDSPSPTRNCDTPRPQSSGDAPQPQRGESGERGLDGMEAQMDIAMAPVTPIRRRGIPVTP